MDTKRMWVHLPCLLLLLAIQAGAESLVATPAHAPASGAPGMILLDMTLPDLDATEPDTYVCGTTPLPEAPHKLVGIVPKAHEDVVHHILLFGCGSVPRAAAPGQVLAWKCQEMGVCSAGASTIIYGWGKNAPELMLPDGVGFSVGPGSGIRHIVVQVHYLKPRPAGDHSGVALRLHPHATPLAAGLMAFASGFTLPPRQPSTLVINECCYRGHQPLTVFAARVHTHKLGRSVFLTRPWRNTTDGLETLVRRDPQLPQAFVPMQRTSLWPGDRLKLTCDFNTSLVTSPTTAGAGHANEMCNVYVMLFAPMPFIAMCAQGRLEAAQRDSTADLHTHGVFSTDPMPTWQPPRTGLPGLAGTLGHCTGVTMGRNGVLWGLFRGSRIWDEKTFGGNNRVTATTPIPENLVVQMDVDTGRVLHSWGGGVFFMPHMITLDRDGNVWVVDTGRHQVLKFSPTGTELLAVGTKLEPGNDDTHLCKPTKVVIANDGSFHVADGYCNSRVVHYSSAGAFLGAVQVPGVGQSVHSVLLDECDGMMYVASREDSKVYAFDTQRLLQKTWDLKAVGLPWSLLLGPSGTLMVLAWARGQEAKLAELNLVGPASVERTWSLPGMQDVMPHDAALGAGAQELTGAADRLFALYVAAICFPGATSCSSLRKFVLSRPDWVAPTAAELARLSARPAPSIASVGLEGALEAPVRAPPGFSNVKAPAGSQAPPPLHATSTLPVPTAPRRQRPHPPPSSSGASELADASLALHPAQPPRSGDGDAEGLGTDKEGVEVGKSGRPDAAGGKAHEGADVGGSDGADGDVQEQGAERGEEGAEQDGEGSDEEAGEDGGQEEEDFDQEAKDYRAEAAAPDPYAEDAEEGADGGEAGTGDAEAAPEAPEPQSLIDADAEGWEIVQYAKDARSQQATAGLVVGLLMAAVVGTVFVVVIAMIIIRRQSSAEASSLEDGNNGGNGGSRHHHLRDVVGGGTQEERGILLTGGVRRPKP